MSGNRCAGKSHPHYFLACPRCERDTDSTLTGIDRVNARHVRCGEERGGKCRGILIGATCFSPHFVELQWSIT